METNVYKPYFNIIALMIFTSLALAFTVDVRNSDEAGVKTVLPAQVDDWTGSDMRFCLNDQCQREFVASQLQNLDVCPVCGGVLGSLSLQEKQILPSDTVVVKKRYVNPAGKTIFVSIVLSGVERSSIHRPEGCVQGQGRTIVKTHTIKVPLLNRAPLDIKLLELVREYTSANSGKVDVPQYYAYWFVGKDRETPDNLARMFWMAYDRIFRNVAHRWAYISLAGTRDLDSLEHEKEIRAFIRELYPEISLENRS
ncbi:MAG: exosortase-associated EpsI family protein [Spartobacteria bacterium]|nr:exosortase-associated EpsI family protein [Spartobacteria bacterium]